MYLIGFRWVERAGLIRQVGVNRIRQVSEQSNVKVMTRSKCGVIKRCFGVQSERVCEGDECE